MKKTILLILLAALLCLLPFSAMAQGAPKPDLLVDEANLLSATEQAALRARLEEISSRQQMDIVIVTIDLLNGKSIQDYADDFYDQGGYGYGANHDGILLLVAMSSRSWWISTTGNGIVVFTDAGIDYLSEQFLPELSNGDYAEAFRIFAEQCDAFITQARTERPYDSSNLPKAPFAPLPTLGISLVIGLLLALIVAAILKGQLKTVRAKSAARDYIKPNSLLVTTNSDIYLYRNVTRIRRETQSNGGSSTHTSSSGRSHGGGGGRF